MSSLILKFLGTKFGISIIAAVLISVVGGIQQVRINSYQSDVEVLEANNSTLEITVELKESEAIDLQTAIESQNAKVNQLKKTALAYKEKGEAKLLEIKIKNIKYFKNLDRGKGPEDLNAWLKQHL